MISSTIVSVHQSVIVRVRGIDPTETKNQGRPFSISTDGLSSFTSSGILLDRKTGLIITTGTLFSSFCKEDNSLELGTQIHVLLEEQNSIELIWRRASLISIFKVQGIWETIDSLLGGILEWQVWKVPDKQNEKQTIRTLLDLTKIAVLVLNEKDRIQVLSNTTFKELSNLKRGDNVHIVGSPYGLVSPKTFMNSVSNGIISNIFTINGTTVLLTDSRCFPGMEGAAVLDINSSIIGILLPPLSKNGGYPMEFTFIIPIQYILFSLQQSSHFLSWKPNISSDSSKIQILPERSLVLVEVENSWASGVIIHSSGYILTNAHLLRPYLPPKTLRKSKLKVQVRLSFIENNQPIWKWFDCEIVYITDYFSYHDISLLKINSPNSLDLHPIDPIQSVMDIQQGLPIFVVGYALFKPSYQLLPTCTTGIISKIVYHKNHPVILQTSAAVHNGNSGGLLITKDGKFLGLVTCNVRHKDQLTNGKIITRLNFSIPVSVLEPLFQFINSKDQDPKILAFYDHNDPSVKILWKLQLNIEEEEDSGSGKENFKFPNKHGEKFSSFLKNFKVSQSKL